MPPSLAPIESQAPVPLAQVWWLTLAAGLVAGWGEVVIVLGQRWQIGEIVDRPVWMVWMVPLVNLALFVIGLLLGLPLLHRLPRLRQPSTLLGILGSGVAVIWLLSMRGLESWSALLLALGLGAALGRWTFARTLIARRSLVLAVGITGVLLIPIAAAFVRDDNAAASSRTMPANPRMNVLILLLDTVRSMNIHAYGYPRLTTPNLDALGENGVRFARAVAPAPWTLPTHATLFTGRWPHEMAVGWHTPMGQRFPTLAEVFDSAGYRTGAFMGI